MNMKKIKKFFTQARRHDGFTLVELIVVIAILAILGGVAVPAYGGYVKKANMQADISLAAEVADALTLYYYSHPNEATGGYVVLTTQGAIGDENISDEAMKAVFGENWAAMASLKYDGWNGTISGGNLDAIFNTQGGFSQDNLPSLLNAVNTMTGIVSEVFSDSGAPTWLTNYANGKGIATDDSTTMANLLPMYVAEQLTPALAGTDEFGNNKQETFLNIYSDPFTTDAAVELQNSLGVDQVTAYAIEYAQVEGMLQYYASNGSAESRAEAQALLTEWQNETKKLQDEEDPGIGAVKTLINDTKQKVWEKMLDPNDALDQSVAMTYSNTQAANDAKAFCGYMDGLNNVSASILSDPNALSNSDLYSDNSIGEMVMNYLSVSQELAGLNITGSAGIIMIGSNGEITVLLSE